MFNAIQEKTLYIFAISNVITLPMVWALYPESNQRTLEDMDLLFAARTPWNWDAERTFARLKAENPGYMQSSSRKNSQFDPETTEADTDLPKETAAHVDRPEVQN